MTLLSVLLSGLAVALLVPAGPVHVQPRPSEDGSRKVVGAVAAGVLGLVLLADGTLLVLGLLGLASGVAAWRLVVRTRRRRAADLRRRQVLEVAQGLAGELRAGQPPVAALGRTAETWEPMSVVAQAARLGADVPTALRRVAEQPGAEALRDLAAAWQVAESSGAGLALALTRVADGVRERESADRIVGSELAAAHATARLVAALPLMVLVLGSGLGGEPWAFLLQSAVGLVCLGTGLALMLAGLAWIERIASAVTR